VERVRGFTPAEAAAQTIDQINTPESAARVMEYFASLYAAIGAATEPPEFRGEMEYYRKDGSIMLAELQVIPEIDDDGHVIQILGVSRDISERRRYEEELNRLAITDPLTGVWDRRHGEELFTADLLEARRYGPAMSLLMLDIDHFKTINDTHGHQVGDRVLVELCERLTANLRTSDVLARWGGEEFVIVMRHCTLADAIPLADKIRHLIADTPFDDVGTITVSIGAAELRPDDDLASWLDRADKAMYQAKAAGRNNVRQEA
jgi:diguanylate cyclase (GGDEF)-like protein/PAS domain S-box-containing protein